MKKRCEHGVWGLQQYVWEGKGVHNTPTLTLGMLALTSVALVEWLPLTCCELLPASCSLPAAAPLCTCRIAAQVSDFLQGRWTFADARKFLMQHQQEQQEQERPRPGGSSLFDAASNTLATPTQSEAERVVHEYNLFKTFTEVSGVGWLRLAGSGATKTQCNACCCTVAALAAAAGGGGSALRQR